MQVLQTECVVKDLHGDIIFIPPTSLAVLQRDVADA